MNGLGEFFFQIRADPASAVIDCCDSVSLLCDTRRDRAIVEIADLVAAETGAEVARPETSAPAV